MQRISKLLPASKKTLVISSVGVVALVLFSSFIMFEATKAEVNLTEDGEEKTVETHANTVEELLEQERITVEEHDVLSHSGNTAITNGMDINYQQANQIIVTIDDENHTYYTTLHTVGEFLAEEDLTFSEHDKVSHEAKETIEDGLHMTIDKAFQVKIDDGGKKKKIWTTGGSIKQLLKENNIKLNKQDKVKPKAKKQVEKGKDIAIIRVEKETEEIEETIDFETETKQKDSIAKGKEKIITEGKKGTIVKTYEVVLENGKEVSRELVSEDIQEEAKNQVVAIGTKEPEKEQAQEEQGLVASSSDNPSQSDDQSQSEENAPPASKSNEEKSDDSSSSEAGGQEISMKATAYTANCNGCSGVTATGIDLNANPNKKVVAVDPGVIPLGSEVWVEGYGVAIAGDTGGAINGNRIDLHVPSKGEANAFGSQEVKVKVIH